MAEQNNALKKQVDDLIEQNTEHKSFVDALKEEVESLKGLKDKKEGKDEQGEPETVEKQHIVYMRKEKSTGS